MKQTVFVAVVLLAAAVVSGQAWEGDLLGMETGEVHGMVGVTWDSEWLWRGFPVYDNKSATHVMADLNLFETGFGMSAVLHRANSSGFENWERLDYTFYYQNGMFSGEPYATNYRFGWVYYNYPDHSPDWYDLQEAQAVFSWPNLLPVKGLCPSYALVKLWPSNSSDGGSLIGGHRTHGSASGWLHILMLDYGFTVPGVLPDVPEHLIKLHAEMVYNDGFHPLAQNVDQDWSHAVFGASTDVDIIPNVTLTPAVYYQMTMEDSVNPDSDELWVSLGLRYSF
ncbi:MAG: hypothetical protein JW741_06940 [Sedimentisphaerales bacterium]|nr:hypothetical protein [Sedimentisphaerales bacterium]